MTDSLNAHLVVGFILAALPIWLAWREARR